MELQAGFGDIHSGIDSNSYGLHNFDRVRTHPYLYELPVVAGALATVRVWSTGRARFWLGYGLTKGHPRVERTRARHRPSVAKEGRPHVLAPARRAKRPREHSNRIEAEAGRALALSGGRSDHSFLACHSATPRCALRSATARQGAPPRPCKDTQLNHEKTHTTPCPGT